MYFYSLYSPFTGPPPPALNPPIDKAVTVHFNAILPKSAWAWDDSPSHTTYVQKNYNIPAKYMPIAIHDDNRLIITV